MLNTRWIDFSFAPPNTCFFNIVTAMSVKAVGATIGKPIGKA